MFGMALSGRAAMKLQESINYPTKTIAGFLNSLDLIDEQEPMLIVIDEASMKQRAFRSTVKPFEPNNYQNRCHTRRLASRWSAKTICRYSA
nr:AAA family ATPase [Vibrio parahaemolyticus]